MLPLTGKFFLQPMPKLLALGFQVMPIVRPRITPDGDFFDDLQAVSVDAVDLFGVVGHQLNLALSKVTEDLAAYSVIALIDRQAEPNVGFDGIQTFFLERVSVEFVGQ